MRNQEQAFRVYYAAMPDEELLSVAANRASFIEIARTILDEEVAKRHLKPAPEQPHASTSPSLWGGGLTKLAHLLHHSPQH
jgi:hypothetical protein